MTARGKLDQGGVWPEVAGLAGMVALTGYLLAISWRKWNHPLIDFGRELYIPWRLSTGAVLYRDVDDVYGPLSQYFNAGLFRIFGPGLMVLVTANLVVFALILSLAYWLFRRAWGVTGALAACVVFVSVFAFSQYLGVANFNYATPYAHEATHGFLICLALAAVMGRWLEQPTAVRSFIGGLLAGSTLVLKPEFILAAGAVMMAAGVLRWRRTGIFATSQLWLMALGASLPSAAFTVYFFRYFPLYEAVLAAGRAWSSLLVHSDILGKKYQLIFMGLDQPWANFLLHLEKTLLAITLLGLLWFMVAWALKRAGVIRFAVLAASMALALGIGLNLKWDDVGRCFLGLNLAYLGLLWNRSRRRLKSSQPGDDATSGWRILLCVLATALMGRMLLNGRIVQFGFFQSALAAMVIVAVIFAESAEWMPAGPSRRRWPALVAGALLLPGVVWAVTYSGRVQRAQTFAVGVGRDQFFCYPPTIESTGYIVNRVVEILREFPRGSTLFAFPEGAMINYLARMPGPLPQFQFYSFTTEGGRELEVVRALAARPPDVVVIASRDLTDFGITRYGERDGAGRQIMLWLAQHYHITNKIGDDPLQAGQYGAYVLQRIPEDGTGKK